MKQREREKTEEDRRETPVYVPPKASYAEVLKDAVKNGYAVGQFNLNGLEYLQAIVEVAEEERSPVILGVSVSSTKYIGLDYLIALANAAKLKARVPIILHLDHGPDFDFVMKAIRAGFDSVMYDGSEHPLEENIATTRRVVEAAHAAGVSVEGEIGRIGGTEDEVSVDEREAMLARVDEAERFARETGIDAIAPALGTAHGMYKGRPEIAFDRLEAIHKRTGLPVVLHGGSGVPEEDIRRAIALGVGKINVNTESQVEFSRVVRKTLEEKPDLYDSRKYLGPARGAIKEIIRAKIRLFGSNNRF
ncbi:MAG: class II fructose-1,6-bisphosphate aldolase [Hydrogenibacillus schlegelii]|nr:class II fructose-1,6-bisphosphate aldolase [Hydrogenibacillus schlegelii]